MAGRGGRAATERLRLGDAVALAHQAAKACGAPVALDLGRDTPLEGPDSTQESLRLASGGVTLARHLTPATFPPQPCLEEHGGKESGQGGEEVVHGQWRSGGWG